MSLSYRLNKTRKKKNYLKLNHPSLPPPLQINHLSPGFDFFRYINGNWLKKVHVPPYISSFGISEEIEELISKRNHQIIKDCVEISNKPNNGSMDSIEKYQRGIGLLAQSALHPGEQKHSVDTVKKILRRFDCLRDKEDIARTLGELSKYKIKGLFWLYAEYQNSKDTEYHLNLGVGTVGLPDASYYSSTAPGKGKALLHYARMLDTIGQKFEIEKLSDVISLEKKVSDEIEISLRINDEKYETTGLALSKEFPDIPWAALFESLGLESWKTQVIFVDSKYWIESLQRFFNLLSLHDWRLLFSLEVLLHSLKYLPPPYDDIHFRFFHKELRGQTMKTPQHLLTIEAISDWMTPFLSRLYILEYTTPKRKKDALVFTKEIQDAAYTRIDSVDWLSPQSKEAAKEKIKKMKASVAYPDSFRRLELPPLQSHNFVENLLSLGSWRTDFEFKRLGERRNKQKDWDESVFAVNAYYFSPGNEIVIPSGSLEWPFFDEDEAIQDVGFNYGGLGAIIGHEMTHAFDEDGKEYDPDGFRKQWWLPSDTHAYTKRAKELVYLFNKQKVFGYHINGSLTLSENIADLGGLAIALDALRIRLDKEGISETFKKKAYRQFFTSFAVSWRVKEKQAKILQSLFVDRHAPPPLRVNLVVSQFQEWYDAFDIKTSDPLYILPEKRIRIF